MNFHEDTTCIFHIALEIDNKMPHRIAHNKVLLAKYNKERDAIRKKGGEGSYYTDRNIPE